MLDISGLSKESVLAALYNAARPKGLGFLRYDPAPITEEEAKEIIASGDDHRSEFGSLGPEFYDTFCFDYVNGRAIKVELTYDEFSTTSFNRNNGEGIAEKAIQHLRDTGEVYCQEILDVQYKKVLEEALAVLDNLGSEAVIVFEGREYRLGFAQHAEALREAIKDTVAKLPE